ncbi:MAG: DNA internalization-related competence protein ComEC/Rec2, partial [Glaciimonas sp.]|nr:DNA internalization-related competence protein ComEC/Rec2 [Glaciimonas sp.]
HRCTLKITNGEHAILLPGDIEARQEKQLLMNYMDATDSEKSLLNATVLLAPHHGSGTSSTVDFLRAVDPDVALFQVGYRNRYHHPKAEVWERYADMGIKTFRNDEDGAIMLRFKRNGEVNDAVNVSTYRANHARYWYGK